jgi:phosphate:Na+ symporter
MTGLGMIFVGLKMMSGACDDDSIRDAFKNVLEKLKFPLLLEILGVIFTAIIQSSSAMTGIVIIMVQQQVMEMRNGLFITLGANVGTCVTALIGIIGANTNSKRTALIHFIFNMSGCIIFTPILWIFSDPIISLLDSLSDENAMKIAYFHLAFNILTACITTPLIKYLVKFVTYLIKDKEAPKEYIEWFIKDKDEKNALMDSRPSSNSININLTNDINTEDLGLSSNQTEHNDDIIIKDEDEIRNEILRKDSSDLSDKDNESNKIKNVNNRDENRNNIFEDKNEEDDKKLEEEKIDEIKNEEKNTLNNDE